MMRLRVIAPLPIDFVLNPGVAELDQQAYSAFWSAAQAEVSERSVQFCHAIDVTTSTRYSKLDADALDRPLELMTFHLDVDDAVSGDGPRVTDAQIRMYPHGIATIEASIEAEAPDTTDPADWLDDIQARSEQIAKQLLDHHTPHVASVLEAVRRVDRRQKFVRARESAGQALAEPMWVSRALLVEPKDRAFLDHWTKDAVDSDGAASRKALLDGESDVFMRWVNYAFVDTASEGGETWVTGRHSTDWQALRHAQVAYATLDRIDTQLAVLLAQSNATHTRWDLAELQSALVRLSQSAEMAMVQRQSLEKYMSRRVRSSYDALLQAWDYAILVEEPVRFKVELCNRRLDALLAKRTARSGLVTDLILLGIGITSIASMALALTDFGRSAATDPHATGLDMGASSFTAWFAAQPIDVILLASATASVALVALYVYFRRDSRD